MFIDRDKEVKAFQKAVEKRQRERSPYPRILCYTGLIGIGKTSLMEHLCDLAAQKKIPFAMGNQEQVSPVDLMAHWAASLKERGLELEKFGGQYRRYRELHHETEKQGVPGLPVLLAKAAMRTGLTLAELHPASKLLKSFIEEESPLQLAEGWGKSIAQDLARKRSLEDAELLLDPIAKLTPVFVNDLNVRSTTRPTPAPVSKSNGQFVILFLDDYEKASPDLDKWLRKIVASKDTNNILWVIASWGGLSDEWELVALYELESFEEEYIAEFLKEAGLNSAIPGEVGRVWNLTRGIP